MQILSGGRLSSKLSFVLLLINDFTGRPITTAEAVRVSIDDAPSTAAQIIKKDGYRVFTGFEGDEVLLDIESAHYCRRRVTIKRNLFNVKEPIEIVRLYPNESYHLPRETTSIKFHVRDIEGNTCPYFEMRMILNGNLEYKLLEGAEPGAREIRILNPDISSVGGKGFVIYGGNHKIGAKGGRMEFVTAVGQDDNYVISLKEPLEHGYDIHSKVAVFFDSETDGKGNFYMALNKNDGQCEEAYFMLGSKIAAASMVNKGEAAKQKFVKRTISTGCKNLLEGLDLQYTLDSTED